MSSSSSRTDCCLDLAAGVRAVELAALEASARSSDSLDGYYEDVERIAAITSSPTACTTSGIEQPLGLLVDRRFVTYASFEDRLDATPLAVLADHVLRDSSSLLRAREEKGETASEAGRRSGPRDRF